MSESTGIEGREGAPAAPANESKCRRFTTVLPPIFLPHSTRYREPPLSPFPLQTRADEGAPRPPPSLCPSYEVQRATCKEVQRATAGRRGRRGTESHRQNVDG